MNSNGHRCFRAKTAMIIVVHSKKSTVLKAETAIIRMENLFSLLKITEHRLTLMKTS